jgi:hypothetical protein
MNLKCEACLREQFTATRRSGGKNQHIEIMAAGRKKSETANWLSLPSYIFPFKKG